jgi:hypothetical protein
MYNWFNVDLMSELFKHSNKPELESTAVDYLFRQSKSRDEPAARGASALSAHDARSLNSEVRLAGRPQLPAS